MRVGVWHSEYLKMTAMNTRSASRNEVHLFVFGCDLCQISNCFAGICFFVLFTSIANKIWSTYCPDAVVVQCGADCINGDPACAFNLTPRGIGLCIKKILAWKLPTLFLGGGTVKLLNNRNRLCISCILCIYMCIFQEATTYR